MGTRSALYFRRPPLFHSAYPSLFANAHQLISAVPSKVEFIGCALTFASEAKFEIEAKISFRLEAKKKPDFT